MTNTAAAPYRLSPLYSGKILFILIIIELLTTYIKHIVYNPFATIATKGEPLLHNHFVTQPPHVLIPIIKAVLLLSYASLALAAPQATLSTYFEVFNLHTKRKLIRGSLPQNIKLGYRQLRRLWATAYKICQREILMDLSIYYP